MACGLFYDAARVSDHRNEWKDDDEFGKKIKHAILA
jgi:hypothetical protein